MPSDAIRAPDVKPVRWCGGVRDGRSGGDDQHPPRGLDGQSDPYENESNDQQHNS